MLEQIGVPRSNAYRWELEMRWLLEFGPSELRRLEHERDRLSAELWRVLERKPSVEPLSLLISGLRLAESRTAEHWRPVLMEMGELARFGGPGASSRACGSPVRAG